MEENPKGRAKGGAARRDALSSEERSAIARLGAQKRWSEEERRERKKYPQATHEGPLEIGGKTLDCAVIEGGVRVISETKFMAALGMYRSGALSTRRRKDEASGGAPIPLFLAHKNLKPFADKHLGGVHFEPIIYRTQTGGVAHGIPAKLIPKVCEVWIDADRAGVLGAHQRSVAGIADILLRGFAQVGIIALVDEATGYQYDRARDELAIILKQYISPELLPWVRRFPDEFFRQIYRLHGWQYVEGQRKHPGYVGKLINKYIYEPLPPGVLEELRRKNPTLETGRRSHKHHQLLTADTGVPHLDRQLLAFITLSRAATSKEQFGELFERVFSRQQSLDLPSKPQH